MLYLIKYLSIFGLLSIIFIAFTTANSTQEEEINYEENNKLIKSRNSIMMGLIIVLVVSIIGINLVKDTYYYEPVFVSQNEIVSIEKNNTKVFCKYKNDNGEIESLELRLKDVDLNEFKKKEKGWKITEYVIHTKTDMNNTLFKILTFGHLPKDKTVYKIEK